MMQDEELITRLRLPTGRNGFTQEPIFDEAKVAAADRIEALVAESKRDGERAADLMIHHFQRAERLEAAASAVAEDVCEYICPSIGLAGRPIPHDPRCIALRAALRAGGDA